MSEIQVLFLHHLNSNNKEVVESNFNSFTRCGNEIIGIRNEDQEGLPGSIPVSLKGKIPRGSSRWSSPDTVFVNYILENKSSLKHRFYMICEYDCYCECNLDIFCEPYMHFDLCAPYVVTVKNEAGWGWFKTIKLPCDPIGLRPSTFILFSKEALVSIAEKYIEIWDHTKDSNGEARLGSVASLLGMRIGQFKNLVFNVSWGRTKFKRNSTLYHPVKTKFDSSQSIPEPHSEEYAGAWEFGRKDKEKMGTLILQTDGTIANYKNYNEVYWSSNDQNINFYSGRGGLTNRFSDVSSDGRKCKGDYCDGQIDGGKILIAGCHWIRRIV